MMIRDGDLLFGPPCICLLQENRQLFGGKIWANRGRQSPLPPPPPRIRHWVA